MAARESINQAIDVDPGSHIARMMSIYLDLMAGDISRVVHELKQQRISS